MPGHLCACRVTQANNFVPVGAPGVGSLRPQRRRKRDRHGCWARKEGPVTQKAARACKRNRNDRNSSNDGRVECTELKRPDAFFWNERTFRKNEDRISFADGGFNLLNGVAARICVRANEGKVPPLSEEHPNERQT